MSTIPPTSIACLNDLRSLVDAVKDAIHEGIHPKMISKGSSGSYFARAKIDGKVQTVAYVPGGLGITYVAHGALGEPLVCSSPRTRSRTATLILR